MRIGIAREVKPGEGRVALTPGALASIPCEVVFEPGAGAGSGFSDQSYLENGGKPGNAWDCEIVVKVKELQPSEYGKPKPGQAVLAFDQFAANRDLRDAALASGATFVSYNMVGRQRGEAPILAPMSAIAGRLAVQAGAWCLQRQNGGSGVLLGGFDDIPPARVVILGAGNVGASALHLACAMGAQVSVHAQSERRFAALRQRWPAAQFRTDMPSIEDADLVIGAVFAAGSAPPKIVTRSMLRAMRRGSALVDVGIDQGGIAETSRQTSLAEPIFIEEGVVHYCVPNMPAACPRTASLALERAVLPYVRMLAKGETNEDLEAGVRIRAGRAVA